MVSLNFDKKRLLLTIILIMIFYVGVILFADINKITKEFFSLKYEFIIPILLFEIISFSLLSFRQKKFLNVLGINLSFFSNFKIYLASMSMIVTPGGSGLLIKSHFLKRNYHEPISKTFPIVVIERFHDFLAIVSIIVFTLFLSYLLEALMLVVVSIFLLGMIFVILKNNKLLLFFQKKMKQIKYVQKFVPNYEFSDSLNFLTKKRIMVFGWFIGIIAWFFDAFAIYLGFLAFNFDFGFIQSTQIFFTSMILGTLTFLPAGIGVTEGSFIALLYNRGIEFSLAAALVLFLRFTTIWFATGLGFLSMRYVLKEKNSTN